MRHVIAFKALRGKDKIYVDADQVWAICWAEATIASPINGAVNKTIVTQIIGQGGHVLTTEKMDEVRRKLGWQTLDIEEGHGEKVA
jgi:hypothetical protein